MKINKPTKVIWHHSNGSLASSCTKTQHHTVDIVDAAHKGRWPGFTSLVYKNKNGALYHCGYHLVIDLINMKITQTRAFWEEGAHTIGMNTKSVGILIIGNYDTCSGETIPKSKHDLIYNAWLMVKDYAPDLTVQDNVPHRTYATKSCYGNSLPNDFIRQIIIRNMTIVEVIDNEAERKTINTLQKRVIELTKIYISLLVQILSRKRLSLRENN